MLTRLSRDHTIFGFQGNSKMLTRVHRLFAVLAVAAAMLAAASTPQADSNRYVTDIKALASPNMEGRGAGTKGLVRAEHLIEKRYKELHLDPAGVQGYAQPFSVITGARLRGDNLLTVFSGNVRRHTKAGDDL